MLVLLVVGDTRWCCGKEVLALLERHAEDVGSESVVCFFASQGLSG